MKGNPELHTDWPRGIAISDQRCRSDCRIGPDLVAEAESEAKQHPEWVRTYGGREAAWFVPQSALHPFPIPESLVAGWPRTDEMPESYEVGKVATSSAPVERVAWEPRVDGRCTLEARLNSPYYVPHVWGQRADGSRLCITCHPLVVLPTSLPAARIVPGGRMRP